ncbi:DUF4123 domain-containing protein [Ralstonia flaminis]|jgi:hypothetical protein|uniref:DUF4123 domain-containing protein n=1 Tax=Ralstonia flaminis TaxID=3058597 RepID=A0ABM9K9L2_9RALS|nr:DUF4123 domain-containing protein [Ralstonia sp. LMG 18101]CAJ0820973.1 hypothetical protein LMG18101_04467 [Ralstonia sp. LMG 18101]
MTTLGTFQWFGQDQTNIDAVVAFWRGQCDLHRNAHWYALIDSAFDHGAVPHDDLSGAVNCYEGEFIVGLPMVAPLLVPLSAQAPGQAALTRLLAHCSGRPMMSLVATTGNAQDLVSAWRLAYWAHLPESQKMLVRFADTRVLIELPQILLADQWRSYCAPITAWVVINRAGMPSLLPKLAPGNAAQRLELDQAQLDALMSRTQPDAALDFMQRELPGAVSPALLPSEAHAHMVRTCAWAAAHRVENLADIAVLAMATEGPDTQSPAFATIQEVLETQTWTAGNLGQVLLDRGVI